MAAYVLDTSAILSHFKGEPGSEVVRQLLEGAEAGKRDAPKLYLSFMTLMELEYLILRQQGRMQAEQALSIIRAWPAELVESHETWRHAAARLKAKGALSTADAWIASLALVLDAELVHKDPDYDNIEGLQALKLPDKKSS